MHPVLAEFFGFEQTTAVSIFMVGFGALGLLAALLVRMSLIHWLMAIALLVTGLAPPLNRDRTGYLPTWLLPVQQNKALLHMACGLALSMLVVFGNKLRMNRVPMQGLFILAITMYSGLLQFYHESSTEGLSTIGFGLAVVPCMLFAAPWACKDYEGCLKTLRAMMVAAAAWAVGCSIQFVINPRYLVNGDNGGRFWGLLANAQGATLVCAPWAVIAIWLALNDPRKRLKPMWIAMIAINLLFVGWTGSRSGAIMLILGGACVLYNRIGKFVLFLPVSGLVLWALSFLSDELQIQSNIDRLTSLDDTRQGVWATQMAAIAENPFIGVGSSEVGVGESSWLAGFASYGIGMFMIMIAFLVWSMWRCATLWVFRRRMPREERAIIDIYIAWNAMYFAAATFEGIILGRSSTSQWFVLMFAGVGVWAAEQVSLRRLDPSLDPDGGVDRFDVGGDEASVLVDPAAAEGYGTDDEIERFGRGQPA